MIEKRLSSISKNEEIFNDSIAEYQNALKTADSKVNFSSKSKKIMKKMIIQKQKIKKRQKRKLEKGKSYISTHRSMLQ